MDDRLHVYCISAERRRTPVLKLDQIEAVAERISHVRHASVLADLHLTVQRGPEAAPDLAAPNA